MGKRVKPGPYKGATSSSQHRRNVRRNITFEITPELGPKGGGGKTRKDIAGERAKKRIAEGGGKTRKDIAMERAKKRNAEKELNKLIKKDEGQPKPAKRKRAPWTKMKGMGMVGGGGKK